jgi:hypothetical protein
MLPVEFEPVIPASEQQKTRALDSASGGMGKQFKYALYMHPPCG